MEKNQITNLKNLLEEEKPEIKSAPEDVEYDYIITVTGHTGYNDNRKTGKNSTLENSKIKLQKSNEFEVISVEKQSQTWLHNTIYVKSY